MTVPPPQGFFAALLEMLERPITLLVALLGVALAAVLGLGEVGNPFAGPWPQLAIALAGFVVAARALKSRAWAGLCWMVGLVVAAAGAPLAGSGSGRLELGAGITEAYERQAGDRGLSTHLGAALKALESSTLETLDLRLAVKDREVGRASLPVDGSAAALLGPWKLKVEGRGAQGAATHARLLMTPRAGGEAQSLRLAQGESAALPGDVRVDVRQISGDFGRALGPAVWLSLTWPEGNETGWHFLEAPELDSRVGLAPYAVAVQTVEAQPPVRLMVARQGSPVVLAAGLILMGLGLLLSLRPMGAKA